ncbi:MAG: DUF5000 domain-containing lipoprotein [Bacteroidales bacterium]|nr:DUF5000 domain-containing lipoprotein [Bacteroidales bacterium]
MKNIIYILLFSILISCNEEFCGQYPIDNTTPAQVTDIKVENLNGKVKISYSLPDETDLLYVKAVYSNTIGEKKEERSSVFQNAIELKGFGKSKKQTINLYTVDRSRNESSPIEIEIEPLDSPIYGIYSSIKTASSWGGFKINWENIENEQIIVKVLALNEDNTWNEFETYYSTETSAAKAIRGLDTIPQTFAVLVKDVYENYTDTFKTTVTPLYEIEIPSKTFKELPINPAYILSVWGGVFSNLFDYKIATKNDDSQKCYYLAPGNAKNPYFSIDLGVTCKLSRFKYWGRCKYAYSLHNPKYFDVWGTNDPDAVVNPENWDGWELIKECESYKPSGNDNITVTSEDYAYAESGEEYEIDDNIPPYRYIRFRCPESWTKSNGFLMSELRFWGKIVQ